MSFSRPAFAPSQFRFGRGPARVAGEVAVKRNELALAGDLKLFAATFAAGFLFVSILIW